VRDAKFNRFFRSLKVKEKNEENPAWLLQILSSDIARSVVFVDTDGNAQEALDARGASNPGEADLVLKLASAVLSQCPEATIGVIAPYRAQVELLRRKLSALAVDVNTVDQFQGKVSLKCSLLFAVIDLIKCGYVSFRIVMLLSIPALEVERPKLIRRT